MAVKNSDIMSASWLQNTNSFQQRIPDPTIYGMEETARNLFDPMNNDIYNEWAHGLINRVGMSIIDRKRFENPLAIFKRPAMTYGKTVQNVAVKWAKAHAYKDDLEDLLRYERPEYVTQFVSVNRFDKYKVSVTKPEMRYALSQDGYGLNELLDTAVSSVVNAEAYDEMNIMLQLFAMHNAQHGIYNHQLSAAPTDKATAQEMLAAIKTYVNDFQFPSAKYNAQDIEAVPTFAKKDEIILLVDPATLAAIDVFALADLFNISRAEAEARVVLVPEFPFPNTHAILTTRDAFICCDSERGMYPFFDPNTLTTHEFYHAQGAYGINAFVPMVRLSTDTATTRGTIVQTVTGVTVTTENPTVTPGGTDAIMVELNGTISGDSADVYSVEPDAVAWTITALNAAEDSAVELNSRTYVDRFNVLHVQKSGLTTGDTITVSGTAMYTNPSTGVASTFEDSATVTIA